MLKLALKNPRSLKAGVLQIAEELGAEISVYTLKRLLKGRGYVWKRMRRALRDKRNEADFQMAKAHLDKLRTACAGADRDFDLIYFDGAGFTLTPVYPTPGSCPERPWNFHAGIRRDWKSSGFSISILAYLAQALCVRGIRESIER